MNDALNTAKQAALTLTSLSAGTKVRVSLKGAGFWTGTVAKSTMGQGADLTGRRGASRWVMVNKRSGVAYLGDWRKSHIVEAVEVLA